MKPKKKKKVVTRAQVEELAAARPADFIHIDTPVGGDTIQLKDAPQYIDNYQISVRQAQERGTQTSLYDTYQGGDLEQAKQEVNIPQQGQQPTYNRPAVLTVPKVLPQRRQQPQRALTMQRSLEVKEFPGLLPGEVKVHSTQTFYVVTGLFLTILLLTDK